MSTIAAVIGRILIALLFLVSGVSKLFDPAATAEALAAKGFGTGLVLPVAIFEIVAGLCLAIGLMTRLAAILLAGFVALVTLIFHNQVGDPTQTGTILSHIALIGGLLLVFAHSQMWWSYDRMRAARRGELEARDAERATRDAEAARHDAELRAARAEGRAEALGEPVRTVEKPTTIIT